MLDPGGAEGAARRPIPKPAPRPVEKYSPVYAPTHSPRSFAPLSQVASAPVPGIERFASGFANAFNPIEAYRQFRRDPLKKTSSVGDDLVQGFQEDPARAAGGLAAMLAPAGRFAFPGRTGNLAARAASYPTGKAPATRYPLKDLGKHAGFDRETARQIQVASAPPMAEHIRQLDNAAMIEKLSKNVPYQMSDHAPRSPDWVGGRPVAPYNATQAYNHPEGFFFKPPERGIAPEFPRSRQTHSFAIPDIVSERLRGPLAKRGIGLPSTDRYWNQVIPDLMQAGQGRHGGTTFPGVDLSDLIRSRLQGPGMWGGPR